MKTHFRASIASALLIAAAGCASGGGGTGPGASADPALAPLRPGYEPSPCGRLYGYPVPCVSRLPRFPGDPEPTPAPRLAAFTSWADLRQDLRTEAKGLSASAYYTPDADGRVTSITERGPIANASDGYRLVQYDVNGNPLHVDLGGGGGSGSRSNPAHNNQVNLAAAGHAWLDFGRDAAITESKPQTPFTSVVATQAEFSANPYALGWSYQSFGFWNVTDTSWRGFGVGTYGSATPASAVPTSGSASFTGKLGGFHVSPAGEGAIAVADLVVHANFSVRELHFSSTNTTLTRDLATAASAPHLNLAGTFAYSPASNTFGGSLTNPGGSLSGSSKGNFYGPTAQELGGVFTVKSPTTVETFTGAYGARR